VKFFKLENPDKYNKTGLSFWFFALLVGLISSVRNLIYLRKKEIKVIKSLSDAKEEDHDNKRKLLK